MNPRPVNFRGGHPGSKTPDERGTSHAFSDPYEHFRGGRLPGPDAPSLDLVHLRRYGDRALVPRRLRSGHRHLGPGRRASALRHGLLRLHGPAGLLLPHPGIDSYSLHPDGFLQKPVRQSALFTALRRCAKLWWDSLERLEILSDRLRVRLPLCDLIWAEGARRGCLVHSSQECIVNCETLSSLEARLPKGLFFRCQRSFLINLTHVRQLDSQGLLMSDGTLIPMNRGSRKPISEAYRQLRLRMEGDLAASPPFGEGCDGL